MDIPEDESGHGGVIVMNVQDGAGQSVYEIVTCNQDGSRRSRAGRYFAGGELVRRTLIDEETVSDDWQTWDAAQAKSD